MSRSSLPEAQQKLDSILNVCLSITRQTNIFQFRNEILDIINLQEVIE